MLALKGLLNMLATQQYRSQLLQLFQKLEQNPAYTDTELHKPTTELLGKEDAAGETSDDVNFGMHIYVV